MAHQVGAQAAVAQRPDLDKLVPAGRDHHGGGAGALGREAHARDPLGVAILGDGELALAKGVPQLDSAVTRTRHNLTVVLREGNRQDVLGVTNEATGALAGGNLPQTQGAVPRRGEGKLAIGRQDNVRDEVIVTAKGTGGETIVIELAGDGPHNDGLVTRRRQDHVGVGRGGGNSRDPVGVAGKGTTKSKLLAHYCFEEKLKLPL